MTQVRLTQLAILACLSAAQLSQRIDGNQMSLPSESSRSLAARLDAWKSARHQLVLPSTNTQGTLKITGY